MRKLILITLALTLLGSATALASAHGRNCHHEERLWKHACWAPKASGKCILGNTRYRPCCYPRHDHSVLIPQWDADGDGIPNGWDGGFLQGGVDADKDGVCDHRPSMNASQNDR